MENKSRAYPNGLDPYRNKVNDNVRNNNFNYINNASQDFTKQTMDNQAKKQNLNLNLNKFSRILISNTLNKYISEEDLNEFPKKIKIRQNLIHYPKNN